MIIFPVAAIALLALVGVLYTFGLVLDQRRTLQTAADAASLSGSWTTLQDLRSDTLVGAAVQRFAQSNGWSSDITQQDDAHLCPPAGDSHLCAYYIDANGDFVCSAGAKIHVGTVTDHTIPPQARGVQVTLTRQVATILPGFVKDEVQQTRVQATGAATARSATLIPVLVPEAVNAC